MVPYDRHAAGEYARQWATSYNPAYGAMTPTFGNVGDADCTHFVSQALKAGGFPEDDNWFFDRTFTAIPSRCTGYRYTTTLPCGSSCNAKDIIEDAIRKFLETRYAYCGNDWAVTDNLFDYLTKVKMFSYTEVYGTKQTQNPSDGLIIPIGEYVPFPTTISEGDVAFFRQDRYISGGQEFNHAVFILGWGQVTEKGIDKYMLPTFQLMPHMVDHAGGYSSFGDRAINDVENPVNKITIVHIPDDIPVVQNDKKGCGE